MNETDKQKPVILAVAFGTSYAENREKTIGAIERALAEAFPEFEVRRAFTSHIIRKVLKKRDGIIVDGVGEALERMANEGIKKVIVQPTHIMAGIEYEQAGDEMKAFEGRFGSLVLGENLLETMGDIEELIRVIDEDTKAFADGDTARVFMGHGSEHSDNSVYAKMQKAIDEAGIKDMIIGTVEAKPDLYDAVAMVKKTGAKRVLLSPLMIVAGDHANNDMAGGDEDSWKSVFEKEGYEVSCRLEGLGSSKGVQSMIVKHCRETMEEQDRK
ncbi:MAG: sirohydrochlorin cobaltochelatase [Firmicutes bacterium]|nr:sirohydrochlorin cobaltochelatase [Bacillota bacterium]